MTELWNFLLVHPLLSLLVAAFGFFRDFGLAVVLVTVAIRLLLYPLFLVQIRSMRVMQELAPALNELKERYGKDKQRLAAEQMKLYKERGYNPASGCLPLILQMPILFAMYAAFIQAPELTGSALDPVLWPFVPNPLEADQRLDLTAHWLPWITGGLGQPDPLRILPVLAGATQLISSIMAQPAERPKDLDPQQRMMQTMTYYLPLITVFIAWGLPAGLALYWVATTLFQIVQQYFVTGWGRLPRFVPFLVNLPSPAARSLSASQAAAIREAEADMKAAGARPADGPGAQRARREGKKTRRRR